jgi:hypothetical protein
MGHLSRQLTIALAGDGRLESTLMSMSGAVPVMARMGIPTEYCPASNRGWVDSREWHAYLRDRIVALAVEIRAEVLVFDGVAPYPGIGRARRMLPDVAFVWMRRGMWIPGANDHNLDRTAFFDSILEPGDLAGEVDAGPTAGRTDAVRLPPVSMLEVVEPLPRPEAAHALGLDPDSPALLVTLGTGRLGDVVGPGRVVLETALADRRWQICLTKPAIATDGLPLLDPDRVIELVDVYPLVRYLRAFDAAVSAAGYNAVHELVPGGIPTLFVPSPKSVTDDQAARAGWAAAAGLALTAPAADLGAVADATRALLGDDVRAGLAERAAAVGVPSGASRAAEVLSGAEVTAAQPGARSVGEGFGARARRGIQRLIGPAGTSLVRWVLRRQGLRPTVERLSLAPIGVDVPGATPLVFGDEISLDLLRSGAVVEHVLSSGSARYRATRRQIVGRYHDIDRRWVALER